MSDQATALLRVESLQVHYGAVQALKGVSLHVNAGEVVTIIGGNGAGKSTLMKAISGLEPAAGGSIAFLGQDITRMPGHLRVPLGIAQSPEGRQVFADQTVHDNLLLGAYHRRDGAAAISADIERQFATFPRLSERRGQMAGTMSGGEQQQLAIGRALIGNPSLMILDEPSEGIQPSIVQHICEALRSFRNELGTTIIFVEQNLDTILAIAERCYIMEKGKITQALAGDEVNEDNVREQLLL